MALTTLPRIIFRRRRVIGPSSSTLLIRAATTSKDKCDLQGTRGVGTQISTPMMCDRYRRRLV